MLMRCAILLSSHMKNHMVGVHGERKTEIIGWGIQYTVNSNVGCKGLWSSGCQIEQPTVFSLFKPPGGFINLQ